MPARTMVDRTRRAAALALLPLVVAAVRPVEVVAQTGTAGADWQVGLAVYRSAFNGGCEKLPAILGGLSARTGGRWFGAVSAHVHLSPPVGCSDIGVIQTLPDGRWATDDGELFLFGPRLALHAGRDLSADLSARAGAGVSLTLAGNGRAVPWAGFGLRIGKGRVLLDLEQGWHWLRVDRTIFDPTGSPESREDLTRAAYLTQIALVFRR